MQANRHLVEVEDILTGVNFTLQSQGLFPGLFYGL